MLKAPYVLFLGDIDEPGYAKTALGLFEWRKALCVAQLTLPGCTINIDLPTIGPQDVGRHGATLIIGVAPRGGIIPPDWLPILIEIAKQGVDIASGMHTRLNAFPELVDAAKTSGAQLIDLRDPPKDVPIATGAKRAGKRLLTVGTDCAVGKKYTALAMAKAMQERGMDVTFRATGQTGIMIAGEGIPIDAVVCDFTAGAAEMLSPDADPEHWDVIEGQGSLFHPSYAGVSLGLLHGSQPDAIIVCHDASRADMLGLGGFPVPAISEAIETNLLMARRTNPDARCIGISANTSAMTDEAARAATKDISHKAGLPCTDPIRYGVDPLVDALKAV